MRNIRHGESMNTNDHFIGMDLGGTFLKFAVGNAKGSILIKDKRPSRAQQSKEEVFKVIFSAIEQLIDVSQDNKGEVKAIGLGSPGAIDFKTGRLKGKTPNFVNWADADIRGEIESRFRIPVWADNDANVMTLAEVRQGAAKGYSYVIALTLGTGIGGGIVINNQVYRGYNFAGAELGHLSIDYEGRICNCGGIGCIEQYGSAPGMIRTYMEKINQPEENITTEVIFQKAAHGDSAAKETIDDTCEYLGAALSSIVNSFNPQIIVIGGGVADAGDEFIAKIWNALEKRTMNAGLEGLKIVRANLGNDAGMVGAMSLAADMYYMESDR